MEEVARVVLVRDLCFQSCELGAELIATRVLRLHLVLQIAQLCPALLFLACFLLLELDDLRIQD